MWHKMVQPPLVVASVQFVFCLVYLASEGGATVGDFCTDVSYWDVLKYQTTIKQCCKTKIKQRCTFKSDHVCKKVPEIQCEVVSWPLCESTPTLIESKKCEVEYQDYPHIHCKDVKSSITHTKKVPECKEITRENCVTDWNVDANGNKAWGGKETCTPVRWEECEIVERQVELPMMRTDCSTISIIKWADIVDKTKHVIGLKTQCQVKSSVDCKKKTVTKCASVSWEECSMVPAEECQPVEVYTPSQEKVHRKNCFNPNAAGIFTSKTNKKIRAIEEFKATIQTIDDELKKLVNGRGNTDTNNLSDNERKRFGIITQAINYFLGDEKNLFEIITEAINNFFGDIKKLFEIISEAVMYFYRVWHTEFNSPYDFQAIMLFYRIWNNQFNDPMESKFTYDDFKTAGTVRSSVLTSFAELYQTVTAKSTKLVCETGDCDAKRILEYAKALKSSWNEIKNTGKSGPVFHKIFSIAKKQVDVVLETALVAEKAQLADIAAIDGGWSKWSEYGQCSKNCGGGLQTRTRTCTNPLPQHNGQTCEQQNIGDPTETKDCNLHNCGCVEKFDYNTDYKGGDVSDGANVKSNNKEDCRNICRNKKGCNFWTFIKSWSNNCLLKYSSEGKEPHSGYVSGNICKAIDGGWSKWSEYGQCSKNCGGGLQTRTRTCTNPLPQHNGQTCEQQNIGDPIETKDCNLDNCDTCPLGWTSLSIGCYRFLKSETFEEAKSNCKNEGGLLVGDNSLYKQEELSTFYKNSGISGKVWLGATYSAKEGEWKWINNNQPMTFNSWNLGEPNNLGNENCVVWDGEESWNDVPCDKIKKNRHSLCEYPGNWGQWSSWSEVETCSRRCGGGKQRVKKLRSCNSPTGCRGESRKIIQRDCNTHACTCINEGRVSDFCATFPQEISSEEKRIFCTFDIEEKREALLCDQISNKIAVDLLNIVFERHVPKDCNYDPIEVLDGDCGQLLRDKVSKSCDDKTCQAKKTEAQRKIDEVIEKTDEAYEEQIEFQENLENLIEKQKELLEHANNYKEHDDKQIEIKIKQKEIMKKVVKNLEDNVKLSQDAKQKLKVKAWDKLKEKALSQTKIETVITDLMSVREKKERLKDGHTIAKNQFGKAKENLVGNKAKYFQKTTAAMGHILNSVEKIKEGDALNVIGGVLDIAAGIGQFLPPPAGIITGTISTIFGMFQGEGAPTLASTQLVIKNQFKKQKEWMEKKFDEVDKQFDLLSDEIIKGFDEIDDKLKKHFRDLKKEIEQKFEKQTDILLMKAVSYKTRDALSQWHKLALKLAFITDNENKKHKEGGYSLIADKMINFGDESKIYEFRDFVYEECKAKSGLEIREYCQVLALATLMMDRTNEIIITKTVALIATSSLNTLDFTNLLEIRQKEAYKFFTDIFASTKEEKFSYISCGLSDRSHAKLSDEQKNNLLDYAEHLDRTLGYDPSLGLTKKLEQRESCVDASYTEWLPVNGDDVILEKKIDECCKNGKNTQIKRCSQQKNTLNGGVYCIPPVLLRCEGFLSVGYCTGGKQHFAIRGTVLQQGDFMKSQNGEYELLMQSDGNLVLYRVKTRSPYWSTETIHKCPGCSFHFQADGNLVLRDNKNVGAWYSDTNDKGADTLALRDDGMLELMKEGNSIRVIASGYFCKSGLIKSSKCFCTSANGDRGEKCTLNKHCYRGNCLADRLQKGQKLLGDQNESLRSKNGEYDLVMQDDGNLVIYFNHNNARTTAYSTRTSGAGSYLEFKEDGNLVIYKEDRAVLWTPKIRHRKKRRPADSLVMQNDGNLVLYAADKVRWSSNNVCELRRREILRECFCRYKEEGKLCPKGYTCTHAGCYYHYYFPTFV